MSDVKEDSKAPIVHNMGCRLNAYEGRLIKEMSADAGLQDVVFVNSCAVTAEAVRQTRQTIRRLAKQNPGKQVVVTGCAAQIEPEMFANMPEVTHVIGNREKTQRNTYQSLQAQQDKQHILVQDIMQPELLDDRLQRQQDDALLQRFAGRVRAYVPVQTGCDHRCTFCIIPYGRGNSQSSAVSHVVRQINLLLEHGCAEIVLTGVDITSWGQDLPGQPSLGYLVRQILKHCPRLDRLRLSSVDSIELDSMLWDVILYESRLLPHLHLSLQSGDDMILKRMKRRHNCRQALDIAEKLQKYRPEVTLGADFIAGFPTETETMFRNTMQFMQDMNIIFSHIFPFSPRQGTPAARMPQLPVPLVKERAAHMRALADKQRIGFFQTLIGQQVSVLMEKEDVGRTDQFVPVKLQVASGSTGNLEKVNIIRLDKECVFGHTTA